MSLASRIAERLAGKTSDQLAAEAFQRAKHEETKVGSRVFGEVPKGVRREFFCLDERTWVWHEESKQGGVRAVRYEIRPYGVFSSVNGGEFKPIGREEGQNFLAAIDRYNEIVDEALQPVLSQFA